MNRGREIWRNGQLFSFPRNCVVLVVTGLSYKPYRTDGQQEAEKRKPRFPDVFHSHGRHGGRRLFPSKPVPAQPGSTELPWEKIDGNRETSRHIASLLVCCILFPSLGPGKCIQMTISCPHTDPLKWLVGGKKSLMHFNSKLESQSWEGHTLRPQNMGLHCPTSGRPMQGPVCTPLGSLQLRPRPEAWGCWQYTRAQTALLPFPRNQMLMGSKSWKPLSYFGNGSFIS